MPLTHFLRLLKTDIDVKGDRLAEQVPALNAGQPAPDTFKELLPASDQIALW